MNDPAHYFRTFDKVAHVDGRIGLVVQHGIRYATVVFGRVEGLPDDVMVLDQFSTQIRKIATREPDLARELGVTSVEGAKKLMLKLEDELADIEWEIDELRSRESELEEKLWDIQRCVDEWKKFMTSPAGALALMLGPDPVLDARSES